MKLVEVERFLKEAPYIGGRYDKKNADPKFIAGCETVAEMLQNATPAYVEMDRLRTGAVNDCLVALREALGITSICVTPKNLQMQYDGRIYFVRGISSCNPKAIGEIVKDLIIYDKCDYPCTIKPVKKVVKKK